MLKTAGQLGVSLYEFYSMTPAEWYHYSAGLLHTQLKQWEHTRAINWMLYKANSDPKKADKNMLTWWPLPTDTDKPAEPKKRKGKRLTQVELRVFLERMK